MSAADMLGQQDDHYDPGCWHIVIAVVGKRPPHVCEWGYCNTTPFSNDSVAQLTPMVGSSTNLVQWGRPNSEEVIKQADLTGPTHTIRDLATLT